MEMLEHARQTVAVRTAIVSDEFVDRGGFSGWNATKHNAARPATASAAPAPEEPQ